MGCSSTVAGQRLTSFYFCSVVLLLLTYTHSSPTGSHGPDTDSELPKHILHGLGLSKLPDTFKMNVSQEEYAKMFDVYLRRVRHKDYQSSYDRRQFSAFKHSGDSEGLLHSTKHLHFSTNLNKGLEVEAVTLRMFVSAVTNSQEPLIEILVYESLSENGRQLLLSKRLDADYMPRWTDIDLTRDNVTRLNLQIECSNCALRISEPVLNVLVNQKFARKKREVRYRTDCLIGTAKRKKCCRHQMEVVFKDLPGYEFILQPYGFDAGFCKGGCPYRYNLANHHASLQSLIWRQKKGAAPKPCCAPSKLDQLEILHLDEDDPTKLKVATWSNMKVIECACF